MQLGPWSGQHQVLESNYLDALKLDDYLLADYTANGNAPVNVYMAYYDSQRKGEAVHSPRACLPGGGWQLSQFDQRTLPDVRIGSRVLRVNRTLITLGDRRQLVYYWFQQRGRVITNEFAVKWYLFHDAVTRHRTDGALVRLITEVPLGASEADADRRLSDIARHMAPTLTRFIPD
jgi:EpsI family protein